MAPESRKTVSLLCFIFDFAMGPLTVSFQYHAPKVMLAVEHITGRRLVLSAASRNYSLCTTTQRSQLISGPLLSKFIQGQTSDRTLNNGRCDLHTLRHYLRSQAARMSNPVCISTVRLFHPKSDSSTTQQDDIVSLLQDQQTATHVRSTMLIKLANENGYLSWCRNAYISALAGYTIYGHLLVPYGHDAGLTFFLIGLMNMIVGSTVFIRTDMQLRRMCGKRSASLLAISMAIMHVILYIFVITAIDRVAEDAQEDRDLDDIAEELLTQADESSDD